jgi:hypothetical protein
MYMETQGYVPPEAINPPIESKRENSPETLRQQIEDTIRSALTNSRIHLNTGDARIVPQLIDGMLAVFHESTDRDDFYIRMINYKGVEIPKLGVSTIEAKYIAKVMDDAVTTGEGSRLLRQYYNSLN